MAPTRKGIIADIDLSGVADERTRAALAAVIDLVNGLSSGLESGGVVRATGGFETDNGGVLKFITFEGDLDFYGEDDSFATHRIPGKIYAVAGMTQVAGTEEWAPIPSTWLGGSNLEACWFLHSDSGATVDSNNCTRTDRILVFNANLTLRNMYTLVVWYRDDSYQTDRGAGDP